jgi:hypothetical protein
LKEGPSVFFDYPGVADVDYQDSINVALGEDLSDFRITVSARGWQQGISIVGTKTAFCGFLCNTRLETRSAFS